MKFDRRNFLKSAAGVLGAHGAHFTGISSALSFVSSALAAGGGLDPAARFVLVRVHGAMDSVQGLHPADPALVGLSEEDLYTGYDPVRDVFQKNQITLGPSAKSIQKFADQMAIVRGIYVGPNDLGHPFAMQHMSSGKTQESAPYWTSYIGSQATANAAGYVVTNAILQRGAKLAPFPVLLTSVLRSHVSKAASAKPSAGLALYKNQGLGVNRYLEFTKQRDKLDKFMAVYSESEKANPRVVPDIDLIIASLYSNLSRVAQLDLDFSADGLTYIDNHTIYKTEHPKAQTERWDVVGKLLEGLEKYELLKDTLVVVVTEFNRTPGMNANGGKDHNYSDNAVALFGRGVNGGSVIGDRKLYTRADGFPYAYWAGSHVDLGTRGNLGSGEIVILEKDQPAPDGVGLIHPGDVWMSVANSFNKSLIGYAAETDRILPGIFA